MSNSTTDAFQELQKAIDNIDTIKQVCKQKNVKLIDLLKQTDSDGNSL